MTDQKQKDIDADAAAPKRWSSRRKADVIRRLIAGEALEALSSPDYSPSKDIDASAPRKSGFWVHPFRFYERISGAVIFAAGNRTKAPEGRGVPVIFAGAAAALALRRAASGLCSFGSLSRAGRGATAALRDR